MATIEQRLSELGIVLPDVPKPAAAYVPAVTSGHLVFLSGQGPVQNGQAQFTGKVGGTRTEADGYAAARLCAINALSALKAEVGDLQKVQRIVKLTAWVSSAPGFNRQPFVVNGASELLQQVFGDRGQHARSAVGTNELPFDWTVELELVAQLCNE